MALPYADEKCLGAIQDLRQAEQALDRVKNDPNKDPKDPAYKTDLAAAQAVWAQCF